MKPGTWTIKAAIARVEEEMSVLRAERNAFIRFREAVRLATPEAADEGDRSGVAETLLAAYQREVMEALEYEEVYNDTIEESLEKELSTSIAELLLNDGSFTQRRKRNLLLAVTKTTEQREGFLADLESEHTALQRFTNEASDIESTVIELPAYAPQKQSLDDLLSAQEAYNDLGRRCERLLEARQEEIRDREKTVRIFSNRHALNHYLYDEMDTSYPVLSAIARLIGRIDSKRDGVEESDTHNFPLKS